MREAGLEAGRPLVVLELTPRWGLLVFHTQEEVKSAKGRGPATPHDCCLSEACRPTLPVLQHKRSAQGLGSSMDQGSVRFSHRRQKERPSVFGNIPLVCPEVVSPVLAVGDDPASHQSIPSTQPSATS